MKKIVSIPIIIIALILSFYAGQRYFKYSYSCNAIAQIDFTLENFKGKPWCRHSALMAAFIFGEYYPIRFAIGEMNNKKGDHVQAQAFIDNEWKWIKYSSSINKAYVSEQDIFFEPSKYKTIIDYTIDRIIGYHMTSREDCIPIFNGVDLKIIDGERDIEINERGRNNLSENYNKGKIWRKIEYEKDKFSYCFCNSGNTKFIMEE